ncbi:hypothetical protein IQ241_24145 [Romeria aff. gracilis LEGE 07310]|uniref:CopG antitoxin of type II toxin-antitoxin system n=1 Tax=Vasconcelosia minhoensis LEGE 07310 TaxID=915328 RepID=A0A8J7AT27_9CYAN|nr:CopG family antitoxin [Romeria gracilis]MBE9080341.1 hypothetical protein [Romeria aff. gracilis LEGE 07310]
MSIEKISQTDSVEKMAQFWDSHDLTDFNDRLEEVTEPVFRRETVVKIRLQPTEVEAVKQAANLRGISYTDLIREWVLEKVHTA